MPSQRLTSAIIAFQALVIIGLLYWLLRERQANPFMGRRISQNLPFLSFFLNELVVFIVSGTLLVLVGIWILVSEREGDHMFAQNLTQRLRPNRKSPTTAQYDLVVRAATVEVPQESKPFYETIEARRLFLIVALATQAISMWFITAGTVHISSLPPDSLHYLKQLPPTYWWGLGVTLALYGTRSFLKARLRTALEISILFLLALYVIGLPSFAYENPRILDGFQHTGNSIALLNNEGWLEAPIWYLRQFPGAYTFFAELVVVAGIDPFDLLRYYVVGLS